MDFPYILEAKRKGKQEYRRFVGKFDSTAKRFETIDREDRSRWFDEHDVSRQPNRVRNFAGFDIFSDNHSARSGQAINRQDFESLPEDGSWEKFASPHASPRSIDFIVPARRCIWRGKISLYSFYLPPLHTAWTKVRLFRLPAYAPSFLSTSIQNLPSFDFLDEKEIVFINIR